MFGNLWSGDRELKSSYDVVHSVGSCVWALDLTAAFQLHTHLMELNSKSKAYLSYNVSTM